MTGTDLCPFLVTKASIDEVRYTCDITGSICDVEYGGMCWTDFPITRKDKIRENEEEIR